LNKGLQIAQTHYPEGRGEAARILRKKAILFDTMDRLPQQIKDGLSCTTDINMFGNSSDADLMKGQAEKLRKELLGDDYNPIVEDEETAYRNLVFPFKR
jgi:hypothetical protein